MTTPNSTLPWPDTHIPWCSIAATGHIEMGVLKFVPKTPELMYSLRNSRGEVIVADWDGVMRFSNSLGVDIGRLVCKGDRVEFKGNVDPGAELFFKFLEGQRFNAVAHSPSTSWFKNMFLNRPVK